MMPTAKIKCPRCGEDVYVSNIDIRWDVNSTFFYEATCDCGEKIYISFGEFESHRVDG